jgi:thiol:disulfide interchange protein DsbD
MTPPTRTLYAVLASTLIWVAGAAEAKPWWLRGVESNESDFLPPDVAFRVGGRVEAGVAYVRFVIADGYYLYKQKIEIQAESPDLTLSAPELPQGTLKTDAYLGTQEIYTQQAEVKVRYSRLDGGAHPMQLKVTYQGCAEAGLCYPPITKVIYPSVALQSPAPEKPPLSWELTAIVAGLCAFLLAGFALRKGRKLSLPAP